MPLYEYRCSACAGEFEVLVRSAASDPRPSCPICGAAETRKLLSLVAARSSRGSEGIGEAASMPQPRAGGGCCGGACGWGQ